MNSKQYKFSLYILNFSSFLQYQRFIMPISYLFYIANGLTFSDFILFQSIFNITCLVSKIPMGILGDIFSKKHMIIISYLMFTLRVLLWIIFKGFWVILAGEILYGIFKALFRGNVDSYIYELLKQNNAENKMLSKYGRLSVWTSLGSAISCFVGVIMYKYFGFKTILIVELFFQLIAVIMLFFIPNIKIVKEERKYQKNNISLEDITSNFIKNKNICYYLYYSALLIGITSILVWNFQPLLKLSSAPIILFAVASFINQIFRALGAGFAKKIVDKFSKSLINITYGFIIISFSCLIIANSLKQYIFSISVIFVISLAICFFIIFNIFTVSKIHEYATDNVRATTSSINTFLGDFSAFIFLLAFKFCYDFLGISTSIILFLITFSVLLFPGFQKIFNKSF